MRERACPQFYEFFLTNTDKFATTTSEPLAQLDLLSVHKINLQRQQQMKKWKKAGQCDQFGALTVHR